MNGRAKDSGEKHPIPGPSPREGKGTSVAGGKGPSNEEQTIHFTISRQTRNLLIEQARQMRKNPTTSEAVLWKHIRQNQLAGYKFRRQHIIGPFIVDFYCPVMRLIIEVDGEIHQQQQDYDSIRDDNLRMMGYKILRFENVKVLNNLNDVLKVISQFLTDGDNLDEGTT